jgi:IclR family transcriptional regulator, KDG regulon repressor
MLRFAPGVNAGCRGIYGSWFMPQLNAPPSDGVQASQLLLKILELVARSGSGAVGVTELARALDTTKSRIYRHLQTMVMMGYLVQPPESDRYAPGPRLFSLARHVYDRFDLTEAARDAMLALRDALGISVVVTELEVDGMRVLSSLPGKSYIEIGVRRGSLLTPHATAQGKIALAFGPAKLRERILAQPLAATTPSTQTDPAALAKELELIRARGWASAPSQSMQGMNALAAPIVDASGKLYGAVAIIDLVTVIGDPPAKEQIDQVKTAANTVSLALGCDPS